MRLFISVLILVLLAGCAGKTIRVVDITTGLSVEIREDELWVFLKMSNRVEVRSDLDGDDAVGDGVILK